LGPISGRFLLADRAGVYARSEGGSGGRVRRVVRAAQRPKNVAPQEGFQSSAATILRGWAFHPTFKRSHVSTSTATTTSHDTGQQVSPRDRQREAQQLVTQQERSAANRLRTTMAAVRLVFTWLGVRKTLAPEQRTTVARALQADGELRLASNAMQFRGHSFGFRDHPDIMALRSAGLIRRIWPKMLSLRAASIDLGSLRT